jgi:hypothetical protein
MRDLYSAIGLNSSASREQIAQALRVCTGDMAERARYILLDEQRRNAYDQAYDAMLIVASIRHTLSIGSTVRWTDHDTSEWSANGRAAYPVAAKRYHILISNTIAFVRGIQAKTTPVQRRIAAVVLAIVFLALISITSNESSRSSAPRLRGREFAEDAGYLPAGRPYHNELFVSRGSSQALLVVNTKSGSDYYIKLVDAYDKRIVRSFYLHGGGTGEIHVPAGAFIMLINQGDTWYGPKIGFGPNSSRSRIREEIVIEATGNEDDGIEITLQSVANGNLRSEGVSSSEFDEYE